MGAKTCGCSTTTCGCCEGVEILTPMSTVNRPGLDSLNYRIGTHGTFFETMKARPAVQKAIAVGKELRQTAGMDEEAKKILFGQTAANVKRA